MNSDDLSDWTHDHAFDSNSEVAERSTRLVMWITVVMMFVEILAGWAFNSMSLLADGWHMSSHAPLLRLGDDEDLKGLTLLYASDAGKHITGQWLAVDGGVSAIIGG
jgi:hypothetical protein